MIRHGMALRADLADVFLLPADLNFAMDLAVTGLENQVPTL